MARRLGRDALVLIVGVFAVTGFGAIVIGAVELARMWEIGVALMVLGVLMVFLALVAALTLGGRR